ncbi:MAG: exosortase/archaeosortase family protein [Chloroflexota bacterium]
MQRVQGEEALVWAAAGLALALAAGLFAAPAGWLLSTWLSDSYYSHGFLVPLVSLGLVWRLRPQLSGLPARAGRPGLLLLALCLALAAEAIWRQAHFAATLAFVGCLGAAVLYLRGWAWARLMAFPLAYLLFAAPLPFVNELAIELQVVASALAAALAGALGVPVQQQGAALSVPGASFVVGLACSGLNSLIALLALGVLLAYLVRASLGARLALVLLLVPIALLANGVRIASLLWVAQRFGSEAGLAYHDLAAGYLSWALTLVLIALACRMMRCQLTPAASA